MRVFNHVTADGNFTEKDFRRKNPGNPESSMFSILDQVENFRHLDGTYMFLQITFFSDGSKDVKTWRTPNNTFENSWPTKNYEADIAKVILYTQ